MSWREPAPGEREAEERSWAIVHAAHAQREPLPRPRRNRAPLVVLATALAIAAAVLSPPGRAVLSSIRDAVRGERNARPALFSLPTGGRLLVESSRGVWVVQRDGSKRLLSGYRDAAWSPRGLYLAAVRGHELRALEPNGEVHWSLARRGRLALPRWSSEGFRIAYLAGRSLRVVDGDGTRDRLLARRAAATPPAWLPATHEVAYVEPSGTVRVVDADSTRTVWTGRTDRPFLLQWSDDGARLLALSERSLDVFRRDGRPSSSGPISDASTAAFLPGTHRIALVERFYDRSTVRLFAADDLGMRLHRIFAGAGVFGDLAWSPDGKWLLLSWDSADQWLFIRSAAVRKVVAVSNVVGSFGANPALDGWCCPP